MHIWFGTDSVLAGITGYSIRIVPIVNQILITCLAYILRLCGYHIFTYLLLITQQGGSKPTMKFRQEHVSL